MVLADAAAELQALLAWQRRRAAAASCGPARRRSRCQASLPLPDGRRRRLSARLRGCADRRPGQRRVMAVVEDRSAEDERDLAQLEIGVLMDTASVGVATYDPRAAGCRAARRRAGAPGAARPPQARPGALQAIGRELVEPDSLPEYERLQRALRSGERTEVRYAVRHPELGLRWLLTRVEPGALAGGRARPRWSRSTSPSRNGRSAATSSCCAS